MRRRAESAHQQQADADQRKARAEQQPGGNAADQVACPIGDEEHHQRDRQEPQPGLKRREVEDRLQVQREVQEHREHRCRQRERCQRGAVERRLTEQRQLEHRVVLKGL